MDILGIPIEIWAIAAPLLGVLIGALFTWMVSSRRINADLKAKTRLEWIKEVRLITVNIIDSVEQLVNIANKYEHILAINKKLSKEENDNFLHEFNKGTAELVKNINLYKLYFPLIKKKFGRYITNEENKNMHRLADVVLNEHANIYLQVQAIESKYEFRSNPIVLIQFRDATSDYLKKEWDKAKRNQWIVPLSKAAPCLRWLTYLTMNKLYILRY